MNARKKRLFWETFTATGSLAASARAAGVTLAEARRLKRDAAAPPADGPPSAGVGGPPEDAAALESAIAALESEAVRRALEGVEIPVFHQGRECGSTVKHSDTLLMFLLKTLRPERYAGGREAGAQARPVVLDIDLSAGEEGGE